MRLLLPCLLLILAPGIVLAETVRPLIDPAGKCGVHAAPAITKPYPHLRWSGPCRDGLADGEGVAEFAAMATAKPNKIWRGHFRGGYFVGDTPLAARVEPLGRQNAFVQLPSYPAAEGSAWIHVRVRSDGGPLPRCGEGAAEIAIEAPAGLAVADEKRLRGMMLQAASAYRAVCSSPIVQRFAVVAAGRRAALGIGSFGGATEAIARAEMLAGKDDLRDFRNIATGESDSSRQAQHYEDKRKERIEESRTAWRDFTRANRVELWVTPRQLETNPFRYEGRTVAFPARFLRMISANVALVRDDRWGEVLVLGVPNDLLQDKSTAVFAGRSIGRRTLPNSRFEVSAIEAVGWRLCRRSGCGDLLEWMDEETKPFPWGEDQSAFR